MMKFIKSYLRAIKYVYSLATFKEENIPNLKFYRIDESEFPGGIHHLKYLNIQKLNLQ